MQSEEVRNKFIKFFEKRGHKEIPSASLVPEADSTTLFTGSGMQPLIPYLFGKEHPAGRRLVNFQRCFRAEDIEETGDNRHTTFFEMLGNWSLGDYFKEEQLTWFFEFLTDVVGLAANRLYVTVFIGDQKNNIPRDDESADIWQGLFERKGIDHKVVPIGRASIGHQTGMDGGRIFYYDASKNWWSRKGKPEEMPSGELGGPDSEVFFDFGTPHNPKFGKYCHPNCDCGRFLEIGNSVFMEYQKNEAGRFEKLSQRNVDFGGGLERITAASIDNPDVFQTDIFKEIIEKIDQVNPKLDISVKRVFADHLRGASFLIADGVRPSNKDAGYILRRLIRRVIAYEIRHDVHPDLLAEIPRVIVEKFKKVYSNLDLDQIIEVLKIEKSKFKAALSRGLNELAGYKEINVREAFHLYETYGLPFELIIEMAPKGITADIKKEDFDKEFEKHQEASRAGKERKFGGHGMLLDTGELKATDATELQKVTRLHTATHLMQAALRKVLGESISQRGSDITVERTRFDFTFDRKLTDAEVAQVEDLVNEAIAKDLPFQYEEMPLDEAKKSGALYFFKGKYPPKVKVYYSGDSLKSAFSKELCGGPHVTHTGEVGKFKIGKQEAVAEGVRRLRATIDG
ncbi:MAG: alanyl-tRNA synthetase [Candidatus Nomurabacteria bacterium GW2011_GWA1_46_11]|uniref:alanine--tRNA ligase n=2 Tax=Parcubacteria group TaxID=1794811 RepID=A0A1G1YV08_9BACT|nr:MAG: alanyl-tRNA synthetase [Parcubacteria group bacterium GW2011_GWA2_46_10]KKU22143.1 MAG: alanyl-tRNA synthetase [Candidatus Nomurabacteria bacterium GW2011_GWA1_46_11]OGY56211.1 MAG: hypothetical protein A2119_01115 [Candidatus Colwellbacteria bacterium GWA2_46_10]